MSKAGGQRRRSLFGIPSFSHSDHHLIKDSTHQDQHSTKILKKRKPPTLSTTLEPPDLDVTSDTPSSEKGSGNAAVAILSPVKSLPVPRPTPVRPPSSVFGSLKSLRSTYEDDAPLTASSSRPPSLFWPDADAALQPHRSAPNLLLHHGEVQTSSSMFRKKKEYLALTDTYILRYKSQAKAAESLNA